MTKTRATRPGRPVVAGDVELPLDALKVGPSLRVEGLDARHVATLAELDGAWPPIVVRREDRSVEAFMGELAVHSVDMVLSDAPAGPGTPVRTFSHPLGECGTSFFAWLKSLGSALPPTT